MAFFDLFKSRNENKEIKYACLGVKARKDEFCQEDLDSCFEFVKGFGEKIFTKAELKIISDRLGFNIEDYYVFIDYSIATSKNRTLKYSQLYLWQGVKKEIESSEELKQNLNDILSKKGFLNRAEIETLSREIGCSVWDRNKWGSYFIIDFDYSDGNTYSTVRDPKESDSLKK
jgi:hypothetical protein